MSEEIKSLSFRESPKKAVVAALFLSPPVFFANQIFPTLAQGFSYNFAKHSFILKTAKLLKFKKSLLLIVEPETIQLGLTAATILILSASAYKALQKLTKSYHMDAVSLKWNHGVLVRTEDNIDMVKIIDYKAPRTIFDSILGLYNIKLKSRDDSDPEYVIRDVDATMGKKIIEFVRLNSNDSYASIKQAEHVRKR